MKHDLEANKQNAIAFYHMAYMGKPAEAVKRYAGAEYIQHNPQVRNGKEGFIEYFDEMARDYPNKEIEFVRAVAEGDLVALHTHQVWPGDEEYVTLDPHQLTTEEKSKMPDDKKTCPKCKKVKARELVSVNRYRTNEQDDGPRYEYTQVTVTTYQCKFCGYQWEERRSRPYVEIEYP